MNVKKHLLAWLLLLTMLLTACTPAVTDPTKGPTDGPTDPGSATQPSGSLPTDIPAAAEPSVQIHYCRKDAAYDKWGFWIWPQSGEGALYGMNYQDDFGGVAVYPLSAFGDGALSKGIGLIPRMMDSWTKDCDSDRLVSFADYVVDENNYYHIYLTQGDEKLYMDENLTVAAAITSADFASMEQIVVMTNAPISHVALYAGDELLSEKDVNNVAGSRLNFPEGQSAVIGTTYEVEVTFTDGGKTARAVVSPKSLYTTDAFNKAYYYDGELGAIYTAASTTFKVWSPVSDSIVLKIYDRGYGASDIPAEQVEMVKGEKGVFTAELKGDYAGKYYTYTVTNFQYPDGMEIVDPYAKSAGINGVRGMIVDFSKTNPAGWDSVTVHPYDRKELTVWETHVADITASDTWTGTEANRKKFLGMVESGTTYTEGDVTVKTGFDHIVELGVNAVQIIPIYDQANNEGSPKFNWGYNPLNYNVLEGSYSSDPRDGYVRINEFKQVVQQFNANGINIIMDVVYNHVSSANGSNFDVLMPGYYYRYNTNGTLSNGSGCGNEVASENPMVRKFMIDSTCFWAREYKLGGFRFDLMGLHDIETMNQIAKALKEINPNIAIYGEPWTGGGSVLDESERAMQVNTNKLEGVGQFNDQMRDALIKGGLSSKSELGWITNAKKVDLNNVQKILEGLQGMTVSGSTTIADPNKTVNYVTCHDNCTLYDRIVHAGIKDEETIRKMAVLSNAVVLTSNGTSFMLAGEEFLRSKGGDDNSYDSGYKVNEMDYALKIKNLDVFETYKGLIKFKQQMAALHLEQSEMKDGFHVESLGGGSAIQITFHDAASGKDYKIIHANGTVKDVTADFAGYALVLDTLGEAELSAATAVRPYETIIACK